MPANTAVRDDAVMTESNLRRLSDSHRVERESIGCLLFIYVWVLYPA